MRLKYSEGKEVSMFQLQFHWIGNRGSHLALRSTSIFDGLKSSTRFFTPGVGEKVRGLLETVQLRYMLCNFDIWIFLKPCPAFFIIAKLIKE